jgi:hypothetical protein
MSKTIYVVVNNKMSEFETDLVADKLDDGWTLVTSWIAGSAVHHLLTTDDDSSGVTEELPPTKDLFSTGGDNEV